MSLQFQVAQLLDHLPVPAFLWNLDTQKFLGSNPAFLDLIGYTNRELLQLDWRKLVAPDDIPAAERAIRSGPFMTSVSWRFLRKDGAPISATLSSRKMTLVVDDTVYSNVVIALVTAVGHSRGAVGDDAF